MPIAYRYHRFSSARQDAGTSLKRQREATKKLCDKHPEWTVVDPPLEDKGESAWHGDHLRVGNLGRFRQRVELREIEPGSILVIENLDRLSRQDVRTAKRWVEDITDLGIIVAVCQPEMLLDADAMSGNNIGSMVIYLLEAGRSNKESGRKSEIQLEKIEEFMTKARKGIAYSKRAPLWLSGDKDAKGFEVIEERAETVRQIYRWSAEGMGFASITKLLNETIPAWSVGYKSQKAEWKQGYVRDILTGPAVEGEYHRKKGRAREKTGEVIEGYYPRIVPAELVASARSAQRLRTGVRTEASGEIQNLFAGRVVCGHCGGSMTRNAQGRSSRVDLYEYLICRRAKAGGECDNTFNYRYDIFERAALDRMLHLALDDTHFIKSDEVPALFAKVAALRKEVELLEARQKRALNILLDNDDADEVRSALNELRPQVAAARTKLGEAEDALEAAKGNVSADEHLRRVMGVRDAIYSDDTETRQQARRTVRAAIQNVVRSATCSFEWQEGLSVRGNRKSKRTITMVMRGAQIIWQFDEEGNASEINLAWLATDPRMAGIVDKMAALENEDGTEGLNDLIRRIPDDMKEHPLMAWAKAMDAEGEFDLEE